MKKGLLLFGAVVTALFSQAQLPSGTLAPNFTGTDINGNTWELYELLSEGKTVVVDVSATWCGPCWNYHQSGALEDLWEEHGVDAGGDVMVIWVEGDASTTNSDLVGTGSNTWGDWTEGVTFPIIDDANIADILQISYFPTIYTICPNGIITETGQITGSQHWNFINTNDCQTVEANDGALLGYMGTTVTCDEADIIVELANLGTNALTSATISVTGVTPAINYNWSGNLGQFESTTVDLGSATVTGDVVISITSSDDNASNNSVEAGVALAAESTTHIRFDIQFDGWPEECSWEILDENGNTVEDGGPYSGQADNSNLFVDVFLPSTGCYSVVAYDAYGDGLHGSQWGGQDGHFIVYSMDGGDVVSTIMNYNGSYDYSENAAAANVNQVVSVEETNLVTGVKLFPNPTSDNATLNYTLTGESVVTIDVINLLGERVAAQYVGNQPAGNYTTQLDMSTLSAGVYMVNLTINGSTSTLRVTVNK